MKLTPSQIVDAETQLQATAISDSDGIMDELVRIFGEHTFLVDSAGLHILERYEEDQTPDGRDALSVVQVAFWTDEERTEVVSQEPQRTGDLVFVGATGGDAAE